MMILVKISRIIFEKHKRPKGIDRDKMEASNKYVGNSILLHLYEIMYVYR